jgi:glycosyltransferase involved in cell wall biosynthesis
MVPKTVNKTGNIVLIVGNFEFPNGNAAGKRVAGIGFILKQLGYEPVFLGVDRKQEKSKSVEDSHFEAFGMSAYALPYPQGLINWVNSRVPFEKTMRVVQRIGLKNIVAFVAYGNPCISILMNKYRLWCRENGIFFFADCVDWIQFSEKGLLHSIIKYLDTNFQKRYVIARADAVIVISSYLYDFYSRVGRRVLKLPPVTDVRLHSAAIAIALKKYNSGSKTVTPKNFVYAGSPFLIKPNASPNTFKDRLDRSISLFYKVFARTNKFVFDIYGLTRDEYLLVLPQHRKMLEEMKDNVFFHGNIESCELEKRIIEADFTILHRDDNLVTRAGFPTKISESISLGVPVIAESTSNIGDYIVDGYNGVLINPNNELDRLLDVIACDAGRMCEMKSNCINDELFDYRKFVPSFEGILEINSLPTKIT